MRRHAPAAFRLPLGIGLLLLCSLALFAQDNSSPVPTVRQAVAFEITPSLRELARLPAPPQYTLHTDQLVLHSPRRPGGKVVDAVEQSTAASGSNFTVGVNVGGIGLGFNGFNSSPFNYPDANIAVGDSQIVQWVNNSVAVFDKSGNALTPAVPFSTFWSTGQCSQYTPIGHPIAQYDRTSKQWLFAENVVTGAPSNYSGYACIVVSTGSDARGPYYAYQFSLGNGYPDLPKWGVMPSGLFQSNDNFGADGHTYQGAYECAYDRVAMEGGNTAAQVCFQLTTGDFALLPADLDSSVPPPAQQDEALFSLWDSSHLALYSFHTNWADPTQSMFTGSGGSQLFAVPAFTPACNGQGLGACVPQEGTSNLLDVMGDRLLYRVAYSNDVPPRVPATALPPHYQHWLIVHDVMASGGNTAERWYEFYSHTKTTPVTQIHLLQSGTYAPDSTNHRWMGSIARDVNGNIMMGYSISSPSTYPSISITGRLFGDPNGTMEAELPVVIGSGAYTGVFDYNLNRWGDYTSMRLDPKDNCTLWYTNEYYTQTGNPSGWSTQINSAAFTGCGTEK